MNIKTTDLIKKQNMENGIEVFRHPEFGPVTARQDNNGKALLKANDVAVALGYTNPQKAIRDHCKRVNVLFTPSAKGLQPTKFIPESDVYRLVMRSKMPEAERFQDWVCEEVLPVIRKTGAYMTDAALQRAVSDPDFLIGLAETIKKERQNRKALEEKCDEQKSLIGQQEVLLSRQKEEIEELGKRTTYVDYVLQCKGLLDITQIAQDYGMSGRAMNTLLHEKKIQYRDNRQWILYAVYKDKGYVHSATLALDNGKSVMRTQWTQAGRLFIYGRLKADGIIPIMERTQNSENKNIK